MKRFFSFIIALYVMTSIFPVSAMAIEKNLVENPFSDVSDSAYYCEAVLWAWQENITSGTSQTTFSPENLCTRGQVVTFLWRAASCPEPSMVQNPFIDVHTDTYYYKPVLWAVEMGITNGTSPTTFSPNDYCTNAQVLSFLWRANGSPVNIEINNFAATYEDKYYAKAVAWANTMGLLADTNAAFDIEAYSPRSNIVTYLYRNFLNTHHCLENNIKESTIKTNQLTEFNYLLYTPSATEENMPLIVYLHGGSGKGSDISLLTSTDGFPQYLKDGILGEVPAYVLIPQMPSDIIKWADISDSVYELITSVKKQYDIDPNRISLTGHSMGGTGTWELALLYPDMFSCIAPLSGSIQTTKTNLTTLSKLPIWAFIGTNDTIVTPDSSEKFITELKKTNHSAKITILEGATHFDIPSLTYLNTNLDLINWLITNRK